MAQTNLPRTWFLGHGCKQVPLEYCKNKIRWGHPDGYFLRLDGRIAKHTFAPSQINNKGGSSYPGMRECLPRPCHVLMALAFYGPRPTFIDTKTGKTYGAVCHHLIPDKLNYRPDNLLCWLTREQHSEADRRQRLLKTVVPGGDLTLFTYERLRDLQDPRSMSRELFEQELAAIRSQHFSCSPLSTDAIMLQDMTHHCEV